MPSSRSSGEAPDRRLLLVVWMTCRPASRGRVKARAGFLFRRNAPPRSRLLLGEAGERKSHFVYLIAAFLSAEGARRGIIPVMQPLVMSQ